MSVARQPAKSPVAQTGAAGAVVSETVGSGRGPVVTERAPLRLSLDKLARQARQCAERQSPGRVPEVLGGGEIDHSLHFMCPTSTALYYAPSYRRLTAAQALRYNQLTALAINELVYWFETEVARTLLPGLARRPDVSASLRECLELFLAEEVLHSQVWRDLNRRAAPAWYATGLRHFVRPSRLAGWLLRALGRQPDRWPVILWVVLSQEEIAMEFARRASRSSVKLEPHFEAAYRAHQEDEIRHVQIDWHLIDWIYREAGVIKRFFTARSYRFMVREFFLKPVRLAVRVVDALITEHPELAVSRATLVGELKSLALDRDYQQMLYSRRSHPVTFGLFDQNPEFHCVTRLFEGYEPRVPRAGVPNDAKGGPGDARS